MCNHLKNPLVFVKNIYEEGKSVWKCPDCGETIERDYLFDQGEVSDGWHTFNELYHHRALLFAVICNQNKEIAWKAKKHNDGTMFDGMFIIGVDTPEGQATYHYHMEYWDRFNVKELECAPEFDGHTPAEAVERIYSIGQ